MNIARTLWILALLHAAASHGADAYPNRPVRVIVPFAPGGTLDLTGRVISQQLSQQLGQTFVVDNRSGATGIIGYGIVVKSAPDGYTLTMIDSGFSIVPSVSKSLPYDVPKDFTFITQVIGVPRTLVVHPSIPAKTVRDVIALAKRRPGELTFPSAGNGTASHLAGEMFKMMAGVDMLHVPHKLVMQGVLDLVSGRMSLMINVLPEMLPFIRSGKLNAIAVTSLKRAEVTPELPTIDESGLRGFAVTSWQGVLAAAKTPPEIIVKLNEELGKVLRAPEMRTRMGELGLEIVAGRPEQFAQHLRSETEKYARIVKASGTKLD